LGPVVEAVGSGWLGLAPMVGWGLRPAFGWLGRRGLGPPAWGLRLVVTSRPAAWGLWSSAPVGWSGLGPGAVLAPVLAPSACSAPVVEAWAVGSGRRGPDIRQAGPKAWHL